MKIKNLKSLENLSLYSHFSGIITIFLGLMVILLDLMNKDYKHIQIGFFVLATGYSFVKISSKLSGVIRDEEKRGI
jgi:hypothetical protein